MCALTVDDVATRPGGAVSAVLRATARLLEFAVPVAQSVAAAPAPRGYPTDRTSTDRDFGYTGGPDGLPESS